MPGVAKRVEPQKRGEGGRFVKQAAPSTEPAAPPTIEYDPPEPPPRTARAGKKPSSRARSNTARTRPRTEPSTEPAPSSARPLGFTDGLLGPLGLGRRG